MNSNQTLAKRGYKGKKKKNDSLKVVYISSPMKVKTSASKFRSLVQQLTGKNSDISQYMDDSNYEPKDFYHYDDESLARETSNHYQSYSSVSRDDSSDSFPETVDNVFASRIREDFGGIFEMNSFYDPSELDVLGSFDQLL